MSHSIGWVLQVHLGERRPPGHEQEGLRPVVVVGNPELVGHPRFPVLEVVPLTSFRGQEWVKKGNSLYPTLKAGIGGIPKDSVVLLDQIQTVDVARVVAKVGELGKREMDRVHEGLKKILGFPVKSSSK